MANDQFIQANIAAWRLDHLQFNTRRCQLSAMVKNVTENFISLDLLI